MNATKSIDERVIEESEKFFFETQGRPCTLINGTVRTNTVCKLHFMGEDYDGSDGLRIVTEFFYIYLKKADYDLVSSSTEIVIGDRKFKATDNPSSARETAPFLDRRIFPVVAKEVPA